MQATGRGKRSKPAAAGPSERGVFGQRLRSVRKRNGWTLQDLSDASGVSITTISRAERGLIALGYENLFQLAKALELDMGTLFAEKDASLLQATSPVVTRGGEGVMYRGESFAYEFLASSVTGKQIIPAIGTVLASSLKGPKDFSRHYGEEFFYVISGEVQVYFETGEMHQLAEGDSIYFNSLIGHAYISVAQVPARFLGVTTSERGMMHPDTELSSSKANPGS